MIPGYIYRSWGLRTWVIYFVSHHSFLHISKFTWLLHMRAMARAHSLVLFKDDLTHTLVLHYYCTTVLHYFIQLNLASRIQLASRKDIFLTDDRTHTLVVHY